MLIRWMDAPRWLLLCFSSFLSRIKRGEEENVGWVEKSSSFVSSLLLLLRAVAVAVLDFSSFFLVLFSLPSPPLPPTFFAPPFPSSPNPHKFFYLIQQKKSVGKGRMLLNGIYKKLSSLQKTKFPAFARNSFLSKSYVG